MRRMLPRRGSGEAGMAQRMAQGLLLGLAVAAGAGPAGAGRTELVSVSSRGAQGNGQSASPVISADGDFVAFTSLANNLVDNDTNGAFDVFVRDRQAGTTELVSVSSGGIQGNSHSVAPTMSADARYIAFSSTATNLVTDDDTNRTYYDVFVRDRTLGRVCKGVALGRA